MVPRRMEVGSMKIGGRLVHGIFEGRLNRFMVLVDLEGASTPCFLPNPGRLGGWLVPGAVVVLREVLKEGRKTHFDVIGVSVGGRRVSIDARVPNKLLLETLKGGEVGEFSLYSQVKPEWGYDHTRFDFLLTDGQERCLLEVKSCTLTVDGWALFPDAPTERGRRHLMDLVIARREGFRSCVLFLVQKMEGEEVYAFRPNDEVDPKFGEALREAAKEGVEVYAYASEFVGDEITLKEKVKVVI